MGSNKKNTSKSKAGCQAAERVAAPDIELKVPEAGAPEVSEVVPETPSVVPEATLAELPAADVPAEVTSAEASTTQVPVDQPAANGESDASPAGLFSAPETPVEKAAPTPNLSLHASAIPLSLRSELSVDWPLSRRRQLFNVIYFGLITFQLSALAQTGAMPWLAFGGLFVCGLLAVASIFYLFNHRHHQTSSDELTPRARRSLRAAALLVPAFLMFAMVKSSYPTSSPSHPEATLPIIVNSPSGFNGEMSLGLNAFKRNQNDLALRHFQTAEGLDPNSDLAKQWIARTHENTRNFPEALKYGMSAIALNPDNEDAHDVAAHAQNVMGNFEEGLRLSTRATELQPQDGEAWGIMSKSYSGLGQYENALAADNNHARYHSYESDAFRQRAQTLERLGRHAEAKYDRELAKTIWETTHR